MNQDEAALLKEIERAEFLGSPDRPLKTPARDALKRAGLIHSVPPNTGASQSICGRAYRWKLTDAGRAALAAPTIP